ncbi:phosphate/phosphite/phosphonate ABC transporter substrate-binding protein [Ktedonosporobacter rubrisoli]|uniref:Phosphate/phosphite/phosphonate ABC transporter substrate-binding protein n=2 Tax=Ktedonosporobacter rubrisoli TaxID=2509675 RepID=A0A4P6K4Z9_KTERU|nr:phosphate/phosphite/phosphonate ABC transporter substrate-binding protein [Ktedonosporobacter rubrisoli]
MRATALLLLLLTLTLAACGSSAAGSPAEASNCTPKISLKQLTLGIIPAENATKVADSTKGFADAVSKKLCVPVQVFVGTNYTATIEALASKKVDVAWFGPFSYVLAADKYNAQAILMQLSSSGQDHYFSYIVTTPKTGIKSVADLKGHGFSFVDPASTSGNLVPRYTMVKNGLDPDKDVKGTFAGGHDASLLAVLSGKVDAGAVASDTYNEFLKQGKFKDGELTIVGKSDALPEGPLAVDKGMKQSDKDAIRDAFVSIKDKAVLNDYVGQGFVATDDSKFNSIRDIAKTLKLNLNKLS